MAEPLSPQVRNVDQVKAKLLQPALTSHYEVYILPPDGAKSFIDKSIFPNDMQDLLSISCSDASLPGSSITTHELNNDFTGVTQRHAYRRLYDDRADFTFYVNSGRLGNTGYDQIRYFEAWMRFITGEQVAGSEDTTNFYRVKYPKSYKSNYISITKFERNLGTKEPSGKITYKFINAFPISIGSMPVSYDSSQLLKVTVSFTYDRYVVSNVAQSQIQGEPSQLSAIGVPNSGNVSYANGQVATDIFSGNSSISASSLFNNISPNQFNISDGTLSNSVGEGEEIINAIASNQNPVESGLPYVGRNIGPLAP